MKINKIIFLIESRFTSRDYERFGIQILQEDGFVVEVWDIVCALRPFFSEKYMLLDRSNFRGLVVFDNKKKVYERLSSLSKDVMVVNLIGYCSLNLGVYRALSCSKAYYTVFNANAIPASATRKTGVFSLWKKYKTFTKVGVLGVWKRIMPFFPYWCLGVRAADFILVGGKMSLKSNFPIGKYTEVIYGHTLDYDIYLRERTNLSKPQEIAVFLDEFLPFHPDFEMTNEEVPVSQNKYYEQLNSFFDLFEKNSGLKVVIAAHPRSNYESMPDFFRERKCLRGETARLVKDSQVVISHCSTSANFAVLFNKPVVFITCSELDKSSQGPYINGKAQWLGKKPIFIDNLEDGEINWAFEKKVSEKHYYNYRISYIKIENSEETPFWKIFANRIKQGLV